MSGPVYALNLFNVADRDEYMAYSRRSAKEVGAHGGRVVALGKFREATKGDIKPRTVMILVEWTSKEAFESYRDDPKIADLHRTARRAPPTTSGTSSTSWKTSGRSSRARFFSRTLFLWTRGGEPPRRRRS